MFWAEKETREPGKTSHKNDPNHPNSTETILLQYLGDSNSWSFSRKPHTNLPLHTQKCAPSTHTTHQTWSTISLTNSGTTDTENVWFRCRIQLDYQAGRIEPLGGPVLALGAYVCHPWSGLYSNNSDPVLTQRRRS